MVAEDVHRLVSTFETDVEVWKMPSFELLVRLFEEQCEVVSGLRRKPRVESAGWLKSFWLNLKRAMQWHVLQTAECASCPC